MSFQIRGTKTSCANCGEVLASQRWQARTAHVCSRRRADYTAALSYADAVARLHSHPNAQHESEAS